MSNEKIISDWVKDGTASSEPVTSETPVTPEPAAPDVPSTEPVQSGEQPRNQDGTFAPKAAADAPQGATDTRPPALAQPPAPGASAQAVQDFLEAKLGDQTFQVPRGIQVPLKRGDSVEYVPFEDVLKGGMRERDYTLKTQEVAAQRRDVERLQREAKASEARAQARESWLRDQEKQFQDAMKDPDRLAQYEQHVQQYAANPTYRKMVDDALTARESQAELDVRRQQEEQQIVSEAATLAFGWIQEAAAQYPGVDPDRVRSMYARELSTGAPLDRREVERIYRDEQAQAERYTAPLRSEMQALKDELAKLAAAKSAESHNAQTQHALNRAKAPVLAPVGGAPPAPVPRKPVERFTMNDLAQVNAAWAKQG